MSSDDKALAELARREGFGEVETTRARSETSAVAVAEQAKSAIQARYIMALQRPRNWDDVRVRLLRECARPLFADVAIYHKPVGDGIEGPSIRFVEAAIRCMTNMLPESFAVYDDDEKRIIRISVTDLEANVTYTKDVVVQKTVERHNAAGYDVVRSRTNARGKVVYVVRATDEDLLNKQNALESKALRSLGLRHLPGDITDECVQKIYQVRKDRDAKDPGAARKQLADAFAAINVMPSDLSEYLGHDVGTASPAELQTLRNVYAAVRDGETSWAAALAHVRTKRAQAGEVFTTPPPLAVEPAAAAPSTAPVLSPRSWARSGVVLDAVATVAALTAAANLEDVVALSVDVKRHAGEDRAHPLRKLYIERYRALSPAPAPATVAATLAPAPATTEREPGSDDGPPEGP